MKYIKSDYRLFDNGTRFEDRDESSTVGHTIILETSDGISDKSYRYKFITNKDKTKAKLVKRVKRYGKEREKAINHSPSTKRITSTVRDFLKKEKGIIYFYGADYDVASIPQENKTTTY